MFAQKLSRSSRSILQLTRQPLQSKFTINPKPFLPRLQSTPTTSIISSRQTRLYSSEATEKKPIEQDAATESKDSSELGEVDALKKQLETKDKELAVMKDNYLRSVADYRNVQDRSKRDAKAARDFALSSFAKDLLASLDNMEAALSSITPEKLAATGPTAESTVESLHADLKGFHEGVQLTERVLVETLAKHGLVRFDPSLEKEKFDPLRHEALFTAPVQGVEDGVAFHTQQKGFELNGRVIRAAKVGVVKNAS